MKRTKKRTSPGRQAITIVRQFYPDVTEVKDATKDTFVEVTAKDRAVSKRYKHKECAMAVACKRAKKLDGVIIALSTAYLIKDNKAIRYKVPESVTREVVAFDRAGSFEPGEYELKAPTIRQQLGNISGGPHYTGNKIGKNHKRHHITSNVRATL